jgi:hypothetical protein
MKTTSIVTIALFTLSLGMSVAFAQDAPGMKEFGVDISGAGTTKDENKKFTEGLTAEQQAKVKEVCLVTVTEPEGTHPPAVVAFCKNVNPPS